MDLYKNAESWHRAAKNSISTLDYQASVFNSCLAVELYLKSKIKVIDPSSELEISHDIVAMYKKLKSKYSSGKDLRIAISDCRKYFNESRYPFSDNDVYTKEFAEMFLGYVEDVKGYIDHECQSSLDDLYDKFRKNDESTL